MEKNEILSIIQPFISALENNTIDKAEMYAFKTIQNQNQPNTYLSLDYQFYKTKMTKNTVSSTLLSMLNLFKIYRIDKGGKTFEHYHINNAHNIIDTLLLTPIDFSNDEEMNSTTIDSNNLKIQFFINRLDENQRDVQSKDDYKYFKHSLLRMQFGNNQLIIVNKVSPIYKPKGLLFTMGDEIDNPTDYKPITSDILKLPLWPHILIINNHCFLIEADVESIFGFERFSVKVKDETVKIIEDELPLEENSFEVLKKYTNKGRNHTKFLTFNEERYSRLKNKDAATLSMFKEELNIQTDSSGELLIASDSDAEKVVGYLCKCLHRDFEETNTLFISEKSKQL